jgi:hypothetical protein
MLFISCLLLSEGIGGAEDRYGECVSFMGPGSSAHEIVGTFMEEKGFMTHGEASQYIGEHEIRELVPISERGKTIGWGRIRLIEVAERGQGQQRFLYVVREAYDDERAWEFKPTT